MELSAQTLLLLIYGIISTGAACYYRAKFTSARDLNNALKAERDDWTSKALARQGISPLGAENKPREPRNKGEVEITPKIAHRGQLEARVMRHPTAGRPREEAPAPVGQVTIHAEGVSADRITRKRTDDEDSGSITQKAKAILSKFQHQSEQ